MLKRLMCGLTFIALVLASNSQEIPAAEKVRRARNILEKYHIAPLALNENYTAKIIAKNFELLDPNYLHFIQKDIEDVHNIEINTTEFNQKYALLALQIKEKYIRRLKESDSLLNILLEFPFNFDSPDFVSRKKKDSTILFCSNSADKLKRIKRRCKSQILYEYYFIRKNDSTEIISKRKETIIDSLKQNTIEKFKCNIHKRIKEIEEKRSTFEDIMINALVYFYDPHTSYFSPIQRHSFKNSINSLNSSFGMYFSLNSKGIPILVYIAPGGPAWKSGNLNEGDKLIDIRSGDESLNLKCISEGEIFDFLDNPEIQSCIIKVEKANGKREEVKLIKEQLDLEENRINSFVLKGKKKIGYINLPSFYAGVTEAGYDGCSNDLAKEVLKLRNDKIDGLILDLRNNSGGYVFEAINIAGIFIDIGPYSIFKEKHSKAKVLKDVNRGTVYDGPLAIMVNNYSASASELLAGTLQDYNRAIIIGSQTFGKASIQVDIPLLDTSELQSGTTASDVSILPSIKTTIGKFYRIRGNSHQQTGITPDLKLVDFFELRNEKESDYTYALKKDSIIKKVYHFNPFKKLPTDTLTILSSKRLEADSIYNELVLSYNRLKVFFNDNTKLQLNYDSYFRYMDTMYELINDIEMLSRKENANFSVTNLKTEAGIHTISEKQAEFNEALKKNILEDYQIKEAYDIIIDLIKF